ncbi:hypothetical protein [Beijerinckia sp. L45]|uniref:hypothetical protein n=1 Tax=Beijerinckia sp. L45 TaxID=1641855 RepID=UPI00131DA05E|nr:hypothetical protein [Beijerinckia sp. L45]
MKNVLSTLRRMGFSDISAICQNEAQLFYLAIFMKAQLNDCLVSEVYPNETWLAEQAFATLSKAGEMGDSRKECPETQKQLETLIDGYRVFLSSSMNLSTAKMAKAIEILMAPFQAKNLRTDFDFSPKAYAPIDATPSSAQMDE